MKEISINDNNLDIRYNQKFEESNEADVYYGYYEGKPIVFKKFKNNKDINNKVKKIKILKKRLNNVTNVITANALVYNQNNIIGYIMPFVYGTLLIDYPLQSKKKSIELLKQLASDIKKLHEYNIVLADYDNNTLLTPDKQLIFIDHDNFGVDDLVIDNENRLLKQYKKQVKCIDTHFDDYYMNLLTLAYLKKISFPYIDLYISIEKNNLIFKDESINKIVQNTINLNSTYNEKLIIDQINNTHDLKKLKTKRF